MKRYDLKFGDGQGCMSPALDGMWVRFSDVYRQLEVAYDTGHQAGREKSPTYAENQQLRDRIEELEALLRELQRARPLLLYGEAWIERIEKTLESK